MSLESWKAEFYPVPAEKVSEEDAIAHSLRKWIGLRLENLRKHNVWLDDTELNGQFGIDPVRYAFIIWMIAVCNVHFISCWVVSANAV